MKTLLNNLYHDSLKKIDYFLFGILDKIAHHYQYRGIYHDVKHIMTDKDKEARIKWFEDFEKKLHFGEDFNDSQA